LESRLGFTGRKQLAHSGSGRSQELDDEGGDDSAAQAEAGAAKPNVLIDTSAIGGTATATIDTPVTSSGNTSLWSGEDGLASDVGSSGTGN
jgi:hypothetical protein